MNDAMYTLKTILLTKKHLNENRIALLFEIENTQPCLYPLLYSLSVLRFQSYATQQSDGLALKLWYEFWHKKYSIQFCQSFLSANYDPEIFLKEIDNFIIFLENNKHLDLSLIRLRTNKNINYQTIAQRIRSILKFFIYLLDEYWTIRYQDITSKELNNHRKRIDAYIENKKKSLSKFSKYNRTVKSEINYIFKSLTNDMLMTLYQIISPSSVNKINCNNPFSSTEAQFRNFLIVHLLINYGLRVGELMLLTTKSIKKSIQNDSYNLIITTTEDEYDTRIRKPKIKNEQSFRVIKLEKNDYNFLQIYINRIRKDVSTEILFISLKPPYSSLSYAAIYKVFEEINNKFKELKPEYFQENTYESLENLTPHVCRHTWAYTTLAYAFKKYQQKKVFDKHIDAMEKAQDDLRVLGGWSLSSTMPNHYAKRFIVERANLMNLSRIAHTITEINEYDSN